MRVMRWVHCFGLAAIATVAVAASPSFVPVLKDDFPDAFVLHHRGEFIAYATNADVNLPMAVSRDLVNWDFVRDPATRKKVDGMPVLAPWVKPGFTWAPEVIQVGTKWHLYYTASSRKHDAQCLGVAVADSPKGPFRDTSAEPLLCQTELGGTIDANPFRDADGKLYLYFKNDGNRVGKRTALWGQQMTANGLSMTGTPVLLLDDDQKWESRVIEAPTMVRPPSGGYQMFFSAGFFGWNKEDRLSPYAMGYARCSGPLGPCKDAADNPILHSFKDREAGCLSGPGHQSIFTVGNRTFVSFHAWAATSGCRKADDKRYLYIAPLVWKDGKPQFGVSLRPTKLGERG